MDQKLQNLLYSLPTRTAWIIVGCCAVFWLLCLTGVLTPPVSVPPNITLFWFYTMLMLILGSGLAVIGAAAVLVLKRGGRSEAGGQNPAAAAGLAGLSRMLDDPGNPGERDAPGAGVSGPSSEPAAAPPRRSAQALTSGKRKGRKRR